MAARVARNNEDHRAHLLESGATPAVDGARRPIQTLLADFIQESVRLLPQFLELPQHFLERWICRGSSTGSVCPSSNSGLPRHLIGRVPLSTCCRRPRPPPVPGDPHRGDSPPDGPGFLQVLCIALSPPGTSLLPCLLNFRVIRNGILSLASSCCSALRPHYSYSFHRITCPLTGLSQIFWHRACCSEPKSLATAQSHEMAPRI